MSNVVVVDSDEAERGLVVEALSEAGLVALGFESAASLEAYTSAIDGPAGLPSLVVASNEVEAAVLSALLDQLRRGTERPACLVLADAEDDAVALLAGLADDVVRRPLVLPELVARAGKQLARAVSASLLVG